MKILLLTDIPPCTNYTSGLVINKWCDFLIEEGHQIFCSFIKDIGLTPEIPSDKLEKIVFQEIVKPREYWGLEEGVVFRKAREYLRSLYHNNRIAILELPRIVSEVSKFASDNDCEIILSSIQGQTMTRLVRPISRKLKLDYVAQTWDPLEWWMKESKFDPISRFLNLKEFGAVAKNSKKFMSMSWAMSIEFEKEYHAHCVTNIPGLQSGMIDRLSSQNDKTFIISFAGQLYAKEEFAALVQALEKMRWRYNDKKIILYLYGKVFDQKYHNNSNIKIKGYVEQGELLTLLASSNLLYCPYWFSKDYEKASRISFPAKLTSFLKTGRPVLMHAPSYASPRIFLEYNSAAYICNSLDVDEMVRTIKRIIDDPNSDKVGKRGYELFEKYMTYSSMKNSLLVSLGLMKEEKIKEFELVRNLYVEKVDV